MSLTQVIITPEVFDTCMAHALTTEKEEIMGLLLGDVTYDEMGHAIAYIWMAMPQIRTDRRKDRVEASPEQLAEASSKAEEISEACHKKTRVIGWYHSHPHITILPSHVDVRTQAMYQNLDDGFIGLIFSAFNQDAQKIQRFQMTAFQSMKEGNSHSFSSHLSNGFGNNASFDFDSPDMAAAVSASMAEARQASSTQDRWVQKKVPIAVKPLEGFSNLPNGLSTLCRVLFEEERHAYQEAIQQASKNGKIDPMTAVHISAEYQQNLTKLLELVVSPSLQVLRGMQQQTAWQQDQVIQLRDILASKEQSQPEDVFGAGLNPTGQSNYEVHYSPANSPHRGSGSLATTSVGQNQSSPSSASNFSPDRGAQDAHRASNLHERPFVSREAGIEDLLEGLGADLPAQNIPSYMDQVHGLASNQEFERETIDLDPGPSQPSHTTFHTSEKIPVQNWQGAHNYYDAAQLEDTPRERQNTALTAQPAIDQFYEGGGGGYREDLKPAVMPEFSPGHFQRDRAQVATAEWMRSLPPRFQPDQPTQIPPRHQIQAEPNSDHQQQAWHSQSDADAMSEFLAGQYASQMNLESRHNDAQSLNFLWPDGVADWNDSPHSASSPAGEPKETEVAQPDSSAQSIVNGHGNLSSSSLKSQSEGSTPSSSRRTLNGSTIKPSMQQENREREIVDVFCRLGVDAELQRVRELGEKKEKIKREKPFSRSVRVQKPQDLL